MIPFKKSEIEAMMREIIPRLNYLYFKHKILGWTKRERENFQGLITNIKKGKVEVIDIELLNDEEIEKISEAIRNAGFGIKRKEWRLIIIR